MTLKSKHILLIQSALVAVTCICVAVRLILRKNNRKKPLIVSDVWVCVAAVFLGAYEVGNIFIYRYGAMTDPGTFTDDVQRNQEVPKAIYACIFLYDIGIYFPKFSILAFYYHIIHQSSVKSRFFLNVLTGIVLISAMSVFFVDLLGCGTNISSNWSLDPRSCSRIGSLVAFEIIWVLNMLTDILIFALPFPLLCKLHLGSLQEKLGLLGIFTLGIITIAVGVARLITIKVTKDFVTIYVWSAAELATAIIVVSLPALRPLLRRVSQGVTAMTSQAGLSSQSRHRRKSHAVPVGGTNLTLHPSLIPDVEPGQKDVKIKHFSGGAETRSGSKALEVILKT